MVKFTINKKDILNSATILAQVAALKSMGATPAENSSLQLAPTSLSLMNTNEANAVTVDNIPIVIKDGDISQHVDKAIMINTKKFSSIIKGGKEEILFTVTNENITVKSGKSEYTLNAYGVEKKAPLEIRASSEILTKDVLPIFQKANLITSNLEVNSELCGVLLTKTFALCTDRNSSLFQETEIFSSILAEDQEILIVPDLFSAVLGKLDGKVFIGISTDGRRMAIQSGNITLYKSILNGKYPKDTLLKTVKVIQEEKAEISKAIVNLPDFISKITENQSIVEADVLHLTISKDSVTIKADNSIVGAEGDADVDSKEHSVAESMGKSSTGLFAVKNLAAFGEIFQTANGELEIKQRVKTSGGKPIIGSLYAMQPKILFFCIARTQA